MKNPKILIPVAAFFILVAGCGFFAGIQYQKSKRLSMRDFQNMRGQLGIDQRPQGVGERFQGQGTPISGEIIDSDEKSITVKLPDDSSRIILVGNSVQINKSAPGTQEDLVKGTQAFVIGSENPDGSISANRIQLDFGLGIDSGKSN